MKTPPKYPSLYQINTRVWLTELSIYLGRRATLDDIPDTELDRFAEMGFDWIWFLSVWRTGELGRKISSENPDWRDDFEDTLPDLREEDIAGSGFAIADVAAAAVLRNNVIVGSVNANKRHWYRAGQTLARADHKWLAQLITRREKPEDFQKALERNPDDIKVVIQFSEV